MKVINLKLDNICVKMLLYVDDATQVVSSASDAVVCGCCARLRTNVWK